MDYVEVFLFPLFEQIVNHSTRRTENCNKWKCCGVPYVVYMYTYSTSYHFLSYYRDPARKFNEILKNSSSLRATSMTTTFRLLVKNTRNVSNQ